jgi:hypothetical protein
MQSSYYDSLTPDQIRNLEIFYPYAYRKNREAAVDDARFVYYTNADTAFQIIKNKEVWMRNATCLNDFMEIEHGFNCLNLAYKSQLPRFKAIVDGLFDGFSGRIEQLFNGWLPHFRLHTYVSCFSEHDRNEDFIGRLSMWRAYGGDHGIAIVTKTAPFLSPSNALNAFSSPVAYLGTIAFELEFSALLDRIEGNAEFIRSLGEAHLSAHLFEVFRSAIVCTKHPGFSEEREWRVIYSPTYRLSTRLQSDLVTVRGTPQQIYRIPLQDIPDEGLVGIEIPQFFDRIIVGPAHFPITIADGMTKALEQAGVANAAQRVVISDIPLRLNA